MSERFRVVDVDVDAITMDEAASALDSLSRNGGYMVFCTASTIVGAHDDPALLEALRSADVVTPDGMPLVWLGKAWADRPVERVYGPDLMLHFMANEGRDARHFLYGGAPGVAEDLAGKLAERFPDISVVGHHSPSFKDSWDAPDLAEVEIIRRSGANIVWVGLGHPKQEIWMRAHRRHLPEVALAGVGAAFDFHTGRTKESPAWMKKAGLQWLHRLLSEPRRLWRRYLIGNTRFALLVGRQWLGKGRRLRAKRDQA